MKVRGWFHYQNKCGATARLFSVLTSCPFVFRVFVADSLIKGAGQGLFAKTDAEANTVMSFYNGVRITHTEVKSTQIQGIYTTKNTNDRFNHAFSLATLLSQVTVCEQV